MPKKEERLTKTDFNGLSRREIIRDPLFDVGYVQATFPKVACIISKKTLKRAVDRNKAKRKLYNLYSLNKPKRPYIIIFYPKKEILYTPFSELNAKMQEIFAKLK